MNNRNYNYDLLRVFACVLIVCMHSPMPSGGGSGLFLSSLSYFTSPALCVFFVLSGALLLPVRMDTFSFLKKRLCKVVMPTIVFSFLYLFLNIDGGNTDWLRCICSIPFSPQGHGVLWFMYTLIGIYILSPIFSKWLLTIGKRELEFYLCLWLVTLCYPILKYGIEVPTDTTSILYYFHGFAGYFLLGYYLRSYPKSIGWSVLVPLAGISVAVPVIFKLCCINVDFYSLFGYQSIFVAILTVLMYKIFTLKDLTIINDGFLKRVLTTSSELTFGIYLIHIAVMRFWLWKQPFIVEISNYYVQWALIAVLTFTISYILTYAISYLPFGDYIIGFKQKRK